MKKLILLSSVMLAFCLFSQETNIFRVIHRNEVNAVLTMLKSDPALINAKNAGGMTPLAFAVALRNHEMAKLLLEKGSLVNCGDNNLRAPIHYANWNNDKEMIELLLAHGAVIDTRAIGAATPLIHSSLANQFEMSKFLIEKGADIDVQCNSLTTPLYFAVLNNNLAYLDYLIQAGAEIDTPDFLGRTPLHIAVRDGNVEAAKRLLRHGADAFIKNAFHECSLMHLAASEGHSEMIDLLRQKGLAIDAKDKGGNTPLDNACRYGNLAAAKRLEEHGARRESVRERSSGKKNEQPEIEHGGAQVVKLQNGSWGVITKNSALLLGYAEIGAVNKDASLLNGHITADMILKGRNVYCIDPDYHSDRARFSLTGANPLLAIPQAKERVTFIFNDSNRERYNSYGLAKVHFPKSGESMMLDDLKLSVYPGYEKNLCYLMEIDGLRIVWLTGICDNYLIQKRDISIIKKLHENNIRPDILFLGSPSGIGPELAHGIRETFLEATVLNPKAVFVFGHEPLERKVRYQIERRVKGPFPLLLAKNPGDLHRINTIRNR